MRQNHLCPVSMEKVVKEADHATCTAVQDVRVDHCRADVIAAEKFPDCSDIVTAFEQVSRKGMPGIGVSSCIRAFVLFPIFPDDRPR